MNYYFNNATANHYFRGAEAPVKPVPKELSYPKMKADFLKELNKGIKSRDGVVRLNRAFYSLKAVAEKEIVDPTGELLAVYEAFKEALDAGTDYVEKKANEVREQIQAKKGDAFIDTMTPQEDATVNSLALTYINQLYTMHGQESRKNALFNSALQSRQGALALLRLPHDILPSRVRESALTASKSPEKRAADAKQEKEIEALESTFARTIMSGFHIKNVRDRITSDYNAMKLREENAERE